MAPYYTDWVETGELDEDCYPLSEEVFMVDGSSVRDWLHWDVLEAIEAQEAGGRITGSQHNRKVSTPLGDLYVATDRFRGFVTLTRFITTASLTEQATEYKLHTPRPTGRNDGEVIFETIERNGKVLTETFDNYYSLHLTGEYPVANRFVEMVDLVTANTTPNFGISQHWYQLAA